MATGPTTVIGFLFRRFRWMALGAGVRYLARRGVGRSVDDAAAEIEDRLPAPVVRAANALPGDIVKAGGAAVVSARAARRSAGVAKTGGEAAAKVTRAGVQLSGQVASLRPRAAVTDRLRSAREAVADQADIEQRELRADFLRYQGDERGATDALLDARRRPDRGPIPEVPNPIEPGRRRFRGSRATPEVARVQRSYRRPTKPWDRPLSRRARAEVEKSGEQGGVGR